MIFHMTNVIAPIDIVVLAVFATGTYQIYKREWFRNLFSLVKFIISIALGFVGAAFILYATDLRIPYATPFQTFLIAHWASAFVLYRWVLQYLERAYWWGNRRVLDVDGFVSRHRIIAPLNVLASSTVCAAFILLAYSIIFAHPSLSASVGSHLQRSRIVRPFFDGFYQSVVSSSARVSDRLFVRTVPGVVDVAGTPSKNVSKQSVRAALARINTQRVSQGMQPIKLDILQDGQVARVQLAPTSIPIQNQPGVQAQNSPAQAQQNTPSSSFPSNPLPTLPPLGGNIPNILKLPKWTTTVPAEAPPPKPTTIPAAQPATNPPPAPSVPSSSVSQNVLTFEQRVFELTNQMRAQNGVAPLVANVSIAVIARAHSEDMKARDYFDHTNPDGLSFSDRLRLGGISYGAGAENIAYGQSAESIVDAWMSSPSHRSNMLNPAYRKIGVGAALGGRNPATATQMFTD